MAGAYHEGRETAMLAHKRSARRLELLWAIQEIVLSGSTTDDQKWDALRGMLDDNELLIMTDLDAVWLCEELTRRG